MKEKFESFCNAINRLKEAVQSVPTELNRDATIQRFEFTYELAWNVLKKYLAQKGIEVLNPRDCFAEAYQQKLIEESGEQIWIDMIKSRNLTSHIYNEDIAKKVYQDIKNKYLIQFEKLKQELENKI